MDFINILKTILGLSVLITLHELGHFLVARACSMRVIKFSVGFGPALFTRKFGATIWQFAAVPLGGFVQIDGMGPRHQDDPEPDEYSFRMRPVWQRVLVIFAGPATNWLLAAVFVFFLASTIGFTRFDPESTVVGEVVPGSAAATAQLVAGDRIVTLDEVAVDSWATLVKTIEARPEKTFAATIEREQHMLTVEITPSRVGEVGKLGIGPAGETIRQDPVTAVVTGLEWAWRNTGRYSDQVWGMITGAKEGSLSGIPGIVKMISVQAARGMRQLLESLAWLSIGLFILNLLPIPALDGGRLIFLAIEAVRGKPVDEHIEGIVHGVGFVLLFGTIIVVSIRDLL